MSLSEAVREAAGDDLDDIVKRLLNKLGAEVDIEGDVWAGGSWLGDLSVKTLEERIWNVIGRPDHGPGNRVPKGDEPAMSIGNKVIEFLIEKDLVSAECCGEHGSVITWDEHAADMISSMLAGEGHR